MTQSRKERNQLIIQEFRAHGGNVAEFAGTPLLLLTTIGAKSGQKHVTPVGYLADGDRLLIFAANGGRPRQPDWYYNLVAHPDVTVQVGTEEFAARALVLTGEERNRFYAKQAGCVAKTKGVMIKSALQMETRRSNVYEEMTQAYLQSHGRKAVVRGELFSDPMFSVLSSDSILSPDHATGLMTWKEFLDRSRTGSRQEEPMLDFVQFQLTNRGPKRIAQA